MEIAIRWSNLSTTSDPRFLIADVTGRTFKHCRVTSSVGSRLQWQELSRNSKVPSFRAFDWSQQNDIVAVGQWSGETTVLGLDGTTPSLSLPVKSQRQCNAVAFNRDSLLATGLEKIRNDFCLNVYDIQHWLSDRQARGPSFRQQSTEPVRKLASSEGIISVKFFPDQPNVLAAGIKANCVRIYDLREGTGAPAIQYQTQCVHNIAIDPCAPDYFASAASTRDNSINIWDRRAPQRLSIGVQSTDAAALRLRDVFNTERSGETVNVWSLKYSPAESGCLGILGSSGNFRIFHTKKDYQEPPKSNAAGATTGEAQGLYIDWTESVGKFPNPQLRSTTKPVQDERHILAFEFMNVLSADQRPCIITLRGNQDVGIRKLKQSPPVLTSSTLHETISAPNGKKKELRNTIAGLDYWWRPGGNGKDGTKISSDLKLRCHDSIVPLITGIPPVKESQEAKADQMSIDDGWNETPQETSPAKSDFKVGASEISIGDALVYADAARRRCIEGYLFDSEKNIEILEDDRPLQDMWSWIGRAVHNASNGKMATDQIDFSYLGLYHLWNAHLGAYSETRRYGENTHIATALQKLATALELWDVDFPKTTKLAQRKLCLHSCGFETNPEEMVDQVKPLALAGRSIEGAFRALMGDDWQLAITALRSGPRHQQNRALGSVIALFGERESPDRIQRQADELLGDDSSIFTKAIVGYITRTPLASEAAAQLPIQYRAALAIKLAPDNELTTFIAERTQSAIRDGDVANILYTGLSGDAFALFTRYVERTHDIQSVVLALSHVSPRFLRHERIDQWRGAYRDSLNAWRLFIQRAAFDMQATQLSLREGQPTLQATMRQVTLRCMNCDNPLHREQNAGDTKNGTIPAGATKGPVYVLGGAKDGTRCPRCGAGLPRCVVCDHRTGIVDPLTKGGIEAEKKRQERADPFEDFTEVCLSCKHVYHRGHAAMWFKKHEVCAAVDCECACNALDGKERR